MRKPSLLLVAFFLLLFTRPVFAPPSQTPEKIRIDSIDWSSGAFELSLSSKFGPATAGENAGFLISSTVEVQDASGNSVAGLGPQTDVVEWREGAEPDRNGFVPLVPQFIPWDRNGGTFTGEVSALVISKLLAPSGAMVDEPVQRTFPVEIRE